MSRLIGPLFEGSPLLFLPLVALALFAAAFLAVLTRVALKGRSHYDSVARSPLDDERISGGQS